MQTLKDKRVLVMGLGAFGGGAGAARYCVKQGAEVTVTDLREEAELADSLHALDGLPIQYRLGAHHVEDFRHADVVVVSPAVDRRENPYLKAARDADALLTSEIELLLDHIDRKQVIGVTGTAGKSTTVAMIGHLLRHAWGEKKVYVGGNIGGSLLDRVQEIGDNDWVVLELSSFMLESMNDWSPHIAVITNIAPNHLDRHNTMEAYESAKQRIVQFQQAGDEAILGPGLPPSIRPVTNHHTILRLPEDGFPHLAQIPGDHNRLNALLAIKAAQCAGVAFQSEAEMEAVFRLFRGLPHRLECVCESNGVRYFNDSKSTTPESAQLAIDAFDRGSVHLILGGSDKGVDLKPLARHAASQCAAVYTIGQTGDAMAEAADPEAMRCGTMEEAMKQIASRVKSGQVVLLSPGCASYDQFSNFQQRGRLFAELAMRYSKKQ